MAEVLITLGIIGVVAALTMPSLISNHKKHLVETRLKHFYSVINQAVALSEIKNGDKNSWECSENGQFWNYIEPYIKYTRVIEEENGTRLVYLSNGSAFTVSYREIGFVPEGRKIHKPGTLNGRDRFRFAFYPNRSGWAFDYHRNKGVEPYMANWNGDIDVLYSHERFGCDKDKEIIRVEQGAYCTAIVQKNGWKIPDDYPIKF